LKVPDKNKLLLQSVIQQNILRPCEPELQLSVQLW